MFGEEGREEPGRPRIPMSAVRRFKSHIGLRTAYDKLNALLQEFPFGRAADKGYDSDELQAQIRRTGANPAIPSRSRHRRRRCPQAAYK